MNNNHTDNDELLRKFMNPGKLEKAPDGFTLKTMTRIQIETESSVARRGFLKRHFVPVISLTATALFIAFALFLPSGNTDFFTGIRFNLPDYSLPDLSRIGIPGFILDGWIKYGIAGIIVLAVFDRLLNEFFRKGTRFDSRT